MTTTQRREVVTWLIGTFPTSARRACELMGLSRSRWHSRTRRPSYDDLRARLRELAALRPKWGYQMLHILLRREGRLVNHKLVLRLYREEGLAVSRRRKKKHVSMPRVPMPTPAMPNERWSMDFVTDALADGRQFRCFTIVDDMTRECPAIEVAHSLPALRVIQVLDRLSLTRGLPRSIVCDNGPEFAGRALDLWAHARVCLFSSSGQGSRSRMHSSRASTGSSGTSASTPSGSTALLKRSRRWSDGGLTTTRSGRTVVSIVEPPPSLRWSSRGTTIHPNDSQPE